MFIMEEMVIWRTVRSVKCKIGELPDQRNVRLGNCLIGEISVEELSVRELAGWGTVSLVIFRESKTTCMLHFLFISSKGQISALEVAYIFKVSGLKVA